MHICEPGRTSLLLLGLVILSASAITRSEPYGHTETPEYGIRVIHVYPHDRSAFTQGLEYRGGSLYESTGLYGHSMLRETQLETGKAIREIALRPEYFGEGITLVNGRVVQLTWTTHTGFLYDQTTFRLLKKFDYPGEGWGLTNDGNEIYMSDGTAQIRCWDPVTLRELRRLTVRDGGTPVEYLNELEYVRGEIYANVWHTNRIARISPTDGKIVGWIDASGLLSPEDQTDPEAVLNGIAYDAMGDRLFVTGKLWPKLFEIRLVPKARR